MTDNQKIGNGKIGGLIEYLDSLVAKGRAKQGVVSPLKIATTKIFETVDGVKWADADVRSVDLGDYMVRFKNIALDKYNAASYRAYETRVGRAISWYESFLSNPGWVPTVTERKSPVTDKGFANKKNERDTIRGSSVEVHNNIGSKETVIDTVSSSKLIAFPFPLSTGDLATLYLPQSLKSEDADRLSNFINALVVKPVKGDDM